MESPQFPVWYAIPVDISLDAPHGKIHLLVDNRGPVGWITLESGHLKRSWRAHRVTAWPTTETSRHKTLEGARGWLLSK